MTQKQAIGVASLVGLVFSTAVYLLPQYAAALTALATGVTAFLPSVLAKGES